MMWTQPPFSSNKLPTHVPKRFACHRNKCEGDLQQSCLLYIYVRTLRGMTMGMRSKSKSYLSKRSLSKNGRR